MDWLGLQDKDISFRCEGKAFGGQLKSVDNVWLQFTKLKLFGDGEYTYFANELDTVWIRRDTVNFIVDPKAPIDE